MPTAKRRIALESAAANGQDGIVMHTFVNEPAYRNADLSCSSQYLLPVVRAIVRDLPPQAVVADLGCGNGSMLAHFRQHSWNLHGFDMSRSGLEEAGRAYPGIQFSYADLSTDLSSHPLAGQCDVIISTEVVEHIFLPRLYAKNCCSLLKRDGILIISTPYHGYWKNLALSLAGKMDSHFTALWDYGHIKFWSRRTLTSLLEETGFEVKQFLGAGRIPFFWKSMVVVAKKI
jgi:2-polyprenyl-6-hydroxyphenyl methylase/3-demethylubiquinone-9 3-methyltransferase